MDRRRALKAVACCFSLIAIAASCSMGPNNQTAPVSGVAGASQDQARACSLATRYVDRLQRGFYEGRSSDVSFVPAKQTFYFNGFAHSPPWDHLQDVPLVFYGPPFIRNVGSIDPSAETTLADVAPTLADLLDFDFPGDREGRPIGDVIDQGNESLPKLIVTLVWDGAGLNVLNRWPSQTSFLRKLATEGASVAGVTAGSAPSVTPPVHATIGTGTFPSSHGIVDITQRHGNSIVDSWEGNSPEQLELSTLADLYDAETGGTAVVGTFAERRWHLGMMGHGAFLEGADKDIGILENVAAQGDLSTNPAFYRLPPYLEDHALFRKTIRRVDQEDGRYDSSWLGHELLNKPFELRWTPVWLRYQSRLTNELIRQEGFGDDEVTDLLFLNYKMIDHVGHRWTLTNNEMREAVRESDSALRGLVSTLNREVGRNQWVIVVTADHGSQPIPPRERRWRIDQGALTAAIDRHFGAADRELVLEDRPSGVWLDPQFLTDHGLSSDDVARFLDDYTLGDDRESFEEIPDKLSASESMLTAVLDPRSTAPCSP